MMEGRGRRDTVGCAQGKKGGNAYFSLLAIISSTLFFFRSLLCPENHKEMGMAWLFGVTERASQRESAATVK